MFPVREDGYLYTPVLTFVFAFSSEPYGILSLTFRLGVSPTPSKTFLERPPEQYFHGDSNFCEAESERQ